MMMSLLRSCVAWRGLAALLLSLVLAACAGGGGGGGSTVSPSKPLKRFDYVQPDTDSVVLNWTNPDDLKATEGIYKFTITYEAVKPPSSGLRSQIQRLLNDLGLGDKVDESVETAQREGAGRSWILDADDDGILALQDNCRYWPNSDQSDVDRDGVGDVCDESNRSISFLPLEDEVKVTWFNPLMPDDAGAVLGIYEGSTNRLGDSNFALSLSGDIDIEGKTGSMMLEWTNPSSSISGLGGETNITQFDVAGFFTSPRLANKDTGEHEVGTRVSQPINLADVDEGIRERLEPGNDFNIVLMATYDNGTTSATVEIRSLCVLISRNNQIAPCGAKQLPTNTAASAVKIKRFNLMVSGENFADEVILDADDLDDSLLSYSEGSEEGDVKVSHTYNASGLIPEGTYRFTLGLVYDDTAGVEQRLEGMDLAALSPLSSPTKNISYSYFVRLGLNYDKDHLVDSSDIDEDADGLKDEHDSFPRLSALAETFPIVYDGNETALDLYKRGGTVSYRLEGLAPNSYYLFTVKAHVREYRNEKLAGILGYRGIGEDNQIGDAYDASQQDRELGVAEQSGIFIGNNTDGDELADVLDPDDDNDRLADVDEPSGRIDGTGVVRDCRVLVDCDGDGLTDAHEYYKKDGDPRSGPKAEKDRSYDATDTIQDCLLFKDCDNDMVLDGDEAAEFVVDPTESSDTDGDGVGDNSDNCIFISNPRVAGLQPDRDGDGRGDACEGITSDQGVTGARGGKYHYRGSVDEKDLTVIPGADNVSISWVYLYPSDKDTEFSSENITISDVVINWQVYNLVDNISKWSLNMTGSVPVDVPAGGIEAGKPGSKQLSNTTVDSWYSQADRGYRFNVTFTYSDADSTEATVYGYPSLESAHVIRLLTNTDGDEYSDETDPNDDNDALLDNEVQEQLANDRGILCRLLEDCDGDRKVDAEDDFPLDSTKTTDIDTDGDGPLDAVDSCLLHVNSGVNEDNDAIDDACDVNTTGGQDLWLAPEDGALVVSWLNPAGVGAFNISWFPSNGVASGRDDIVKFELAGGSFTQGSYSHYRIDNLANGVSYRVQVDLQNKVEGSLISSLGSAGGALYSMVVGLDTDGDLVIDDLDEDADNDGLLNTHPTEMMKNAANTSCSLLVDCDGDEVVDAKDLFPTDPDETQDSDNDRVGNNADAFPMNAEEDEDSDFDGFGDRVDNCNFTYNNDQANTDGDAFGDACEQEQDIAYANDANRDRVDRVGSSSLTYPVEDEVTGDVTPELNSEVKLTWTNPTNLYLPKAIAQPQALDVSSFELKILQDGVPLKQDRLDEVDIINISGADQMEVAALNTAAGVENGYRIRGLDNGTLYTFVISAYYDYVALNDDYLALNDDSKGNYSDPQNTELVKGKIILATVEVLTPAVDGGPAIEFTASSGADQVSIDWTLPDDDSIPDGYTLTTIEVLGCQLDSPRDHCDASLNGTVFKIVSGADLEATAPPATTLGTDDGFVRAYLYSVTLNATYEKDTGGLDKVSSEPMRVAIYPHSDSIPGPMNLTTQDREGGFRLRWNSVDPATAIGYDDFERIGEEIESYNLTIYVDEADGSYRSTRIFTSSARAALDETIDSDTIITNPTDRQAGRFYHIELSAIYTTGQRSAVGTTADTGYVKAAIWPRPVGVTDVMGDASGTSFSVTWVNPPDTIAAFDNINQGIDYFLVQACKRGVNPLDCSQETRQDVSTATQQTILKGHGLDFNNAYEFKVTTIYSTGQRSRSVVSSGTQQIELTADLEVATITATTDSVTELILEWTNPPEPSNSNIAAALRIKQFKIVPCRYMHINETSCSPQPADEVVLGTDDANIAWGASNSYDIAEKVNPAHPYDFDITVVYIEIGSDDRSSDPVKTTAAGFLLPDVIPGVEGISVTYGLGDFVLSWSAPSDTSNFDRIGREISNYRIDIYQGKLDGLTAYSGAFTAGQPVLRGTMLINADDTQFKQPGLTSRYIVNNNLLNAGLGSGASHTAFTPMADEIYTVNITTIYTSGQSSPFDPVETKAFISLGPNLVEPEVTAATKEDSLDVSFNHDGLASDFVALGYELHFHVGIGCPTLVGLGCIRIDEFANPDNPVRFTQTKGFGQQGNRDIDRGHWYLVTVDANYTAPDETRRTLAGTSHGGIYPEEVGVTDIQIHSTTGPLGISYQWDPGDAVEPDFLLGTGYERGVIVTGTAADSGDDWETALLGPDTSIIMTRSTSIGQTQSSFGQLYDVTVTASYTGNANHVYGRNITSSVHQGGSYPMNDNVSKVRELQAESGEDSITVTWRIPNLNSIGSNFRSVLRYNVDNYTLRACQTNAPTVCRESIESGGPLTKHIGLSDTDIARGKLYTIRVRANYQGLDSDTSAHATPKLSSAYTEISGSYINPSLIEAHKASHVKANEEQAGRSVQVNFTQPSDVTAFTELGFNNLTYHLGLYDSTDRLVADTLKIPQSFNTLGGIVTGIFTFTDLPVGDDYYVRVRTIYPTKQVTDALSTPFSITAVDVDGDNDGLIEIANADELLLIGQDLSGAGLDGVSGGCPDTGCIGYELTNDIMLTDAWLPLGDDTDATDGLCWGDGAFTGILEGNGHTIRGLTINQAANDCTGFFAQLKDTEVRNLTIEATEIIGLKNVGVLAGWAQNVVINNVHVKSQSLKGAQAVGGLVGRIHLDDGSSVVSMHAAATDLPQSVPPATTPSIKHSSAHSEQITACSSAGGLVGESDGIMIEGSHAISRGIILPFDQATEPAGIDCAGVRSLYRYQVTHHVYKSVGGLVGDGDSSLRQGGGNLWDQLYGSDGRIIITIGDYLVGDETRFPSDGVSTTTYADLNLTSVVERATRIVSSYAISGDLIGNWKIGGLMGDGSGSTLQDSYAVTKNIHARLRTAGGLIGQADGSDILRSYAISGTINASGSTTGLNDSDKANGEAGGLMGRATGDITLRSTYALTNSIVGGKEDRGNGLGSAAGLLGSRYNRAKDDNSNLNYILDTSYTAFRYISGFENSPLVGRKALDNIIFHDTYWDTNATLNHVLYDQNIIDTDKDNMGNHLFHGVLVSVYERQRWDVRQRHTQNPYLVPQPTASLHTGNFVTGWPGDVNPMFGQGDANDIYIRWKPLQCDGNPIWDFGTDSQYPAISCTPDMPTDQRAWYSLDESNKIQVNTDLIDSTITTRLQ